MVIVLLFMFLLKYYKIYHYKMVQFLQLMLTTLAFQRMDGFLLIFLILFTRTKIIIKLISLIIIKQLNHYHFVV